MAGTSVYLRRGESQESLLRRWTRKLRKEGTIDEIRHPVHGTPECRNISKPNLKKKYKSQQAERRRIAEERRKERRLKNKRERIRKQNKKKIAVQKQRQAAKEKTFQGKQTN
jgi:hypothetical protein